MLLSFHAVHSQYLVSPHWFDFYKYYTDDKQYLGAISGLDEAISRVRSLLQIYGVYHNTMLWFSSDKGLQKGELGSTRGLCGRKGSQWEGSIQVPDIIECPKMTSVKYTLSRNYGNGTSQLASIPYVRFQF